jgi:hypothetical protein
MMAIIMAVMMASAAVSGAIAAAAGICAGAGAFIIEGITRAGGVGIGRSAPAAGIAAYMTQRAAGTGGIDAAGITASGTGIIINITAGIAAAGRTVIGHWDASLFGGQCILCVKSTGCQQDIHGQKVRYIHIIHRRLWINLCCVIEAGAEIW